MLHFSDNISIQQPKQYRLIIHNKSSKIPCTMIMKNNLGIFFKNTGQYLEGLA